MINNIIKKYISIIPSLERVLFLVCSFVIVMIVAFFLAGDLDIIPLFIAIAVTLALFLPSIMTAKKLRRPLLIAISITAVVLRFSPVLFNYTYYCENNNSDTGVHYYGAQELAAGNPSSFIFDYEKQFPFLIPYTALLSVFTTFLPINLAIIFLNVTLDCIGFLFALLFSKKHLKNSKRLPFFWIINPISIVMCWLPLNIILINALVMIVIFLASSIFTSFKARNLKQSVSLCILFGSAIAFFNLFRPLFTVFLIASVMVLLLQVKKRKSIASSLVCLFAMCLSFFIISTCSHTIIEHLLKAPVYHETGGWSFFVGANYESKGAWSRSDSSFFYNVLLPEKSNVLEANKTAKQLGIQRYKAIGVRLPLHIANKASVLFSNIKDIVYDARSVFNFNPTGKVMTFSHSAISIFFIAVFYLTVVFITHVVRFKQKISAYSLFIIVSIAGLTAASLLVEVMNRYFTIFIPFFLVLASIEPYKPITLKNVKLFLKPASNIKHP